MSTREGNLEAPTRHAIDWQDPKYHDAADCDKELERVFDICHGCRRCVSLCNSFPTLFDLVDNSSTLEVDGVDKKDFIKVVDQCYLCDLCYMTKCPYVPPHPWNLDFPHLMLRAKAIKFNNGEVKKSEQLLASTDLQGQIAGVPIVVQAANAFTDLKPVRKLMQRALGVHHKAWLPKLATRTLSQSAAPSQPDLTPRNGERTPGKVAIFATCYVNNNEPQIGHDLLKVLSHNGIAYQLVNEARCCGMPKLELGDLAAVRKAKEANIPLLAQKAREGYALMSPVPSCTLMFKQELPLLFPDDPEVKLVQDAMWDPFEYLVARHKDRLLQTDFKTELGNVSYHVPCHGRVQNMGRKTEELFKLVPGTKMTVIERCSGHAGTYGVKTEHHATAMKIGKPVVKAMATAEADYMASDCPLAGHHLAQGMDEQQLPKPALQHPISLLRIAYGLS
ncbi:Fe-S oxidoreductase [Permianibacter sp. IMCC34836]|uniref:heterodisulfide reductase-related iron-sulfur binding cluster n=1 Tax=Permianibacter fluminis TaxID=2738515 RepID=UPI0015552533|nr:heterodisulfide reductase-related iron-sulfur binding cluster [Permianibacter fluminis]NQD36727.1 Fe-S oxidoreductase [Permianibacter fluminis]